MSKTIIEEHCDGELSASNTNEGAMFKIVLQAVSRTEKTGENR